jgi:thiamine biosynthesis lipoprotein
MSDMAVEGSRTVHHIEHAMGTAFVFDVGIASDVDEHEVLTGIRHAVASIHRADAVFSTWNEDSPISRLRRGEILVPQAPEEMAEVLEACAVARDISRGWFDPWKMPGGVDPTGFVKGWAAQNALDVIRASGATSALVNAAGDIATLGGLPTGEPFRIGVLDPDKPHSLACVVEICGAIATSGTYERGAHLVDPRSGLPRSRVASASVVGPDLGTADALATALAVAGEEGLSFIESQEGFEAFVICTDGAWRWTAGFPFASHG